MSSHIQWGLASRPGNGHSASVNQDAAGIVQMRSGLLDTEPLFVACLADGMGGLEAAEEASDLAVRSALAYVLNPTNISIGELAIDAVIAANKTLVEYAASRNIGSTLTCVVLQGTTVSIGHIGDNRLYHITQAGLKCLTVDHSKLAQETGIQNPELGLVKNHPTSRRLTKSLGEQLFDRDFVFKLNSKCRLGPHEAFVLCTDGVWTELFEDELRDIVLHLPPIQAADRLVDVAIERDPTDDASAIVLAF